MPHNHAPSNASTKHFGRARATNPRLFTKNSRAYEKDNHRRKGRGRLKSTRTNGPARVRNHVAHVFNGSCELKSKVARALRLRRTCAANLLDISHSKADVVHHLQRKLPPYGGGLWLCRWLYGCTHAFFTTATAPSGKIVEERSPDDSQAAKWID
jgi:hypothetical protein